MPKFSNGIHIKARVRMTGVHCKGIRGVRRSHKYDAGTDDEATRRQLEGGTKKHIRSWACMRESTEFEGGSSREDPSRKTRGYGEG